MRPSPRSWRPRSGVALTAVLSCARHRAIRFGRLVKAAERIAAGDYTIDGATRRRRARGSPRHAPINGIADALADTHDRATIDRLTGVANRQALLADLFAEVERADPLRPAAVASRSSTSTTSRRSTTRYGHARGDIVLRGVAQTLAANLRAHRHDRPLRRRGVHAHPDRDRRRGRRRPRREAARRSSSASVRGRGQRRARRSPSRSASPAASGQQLRMDTLVRDADAAMYSAKSLGRNQTYIFAEPDDDARVPRAPISAAGRARAVRDRPSGPRGRDGRPDLVLIARSPTTAASRRRSSPRSSSTMARQLELPDAGDRPDPRRRAAPRRRQGRRARGDPRQAVGPDLGRVADRRPAPAHRPGHPRAGRRAQGRGADHPPPPRALRRPRLPVRPARRTRSRWAPGSWRSPTPTTR